MTIAPDPNNNPLEPPDDEDNHPAFSEIDLQQLASELFANNNYPGTDPLNGEVPPVDPNAQPPNPATPPVPPAPPAQPSNILAGQSIPDQDARSLANFYAWLNANPEKVSEINAIMEGRTQAPPPIPTPPTPASQQEPEFDDPALKTLWQANQQTLQELQNLKQSTEKQLIEQQRQRAASDVESAVQNFSRSHPHFTAEDIAEIRSTVANLNIVPGLLKVEASPIAALEKAMDIASYQSPTARQRAIAATTPPDPNTPSPPTPDQVRQQKLTSLSGSSGSAPRTDPRPRLDSDQTMKDAIAKAVEPFFGNS